MMLGSLFVAMIVIIHTNDCNMLCLCTLCMPMLCKKGDAVYTCVWGKGGGWERRNVNLCTIMINSPASFL